MANLVVQDLCSRPRQRSKSRVLQHREVIRKRHAGQLDAVNYFHRRERVDVHPRSRLLDRAKQVAIVIRMQITRQPALHANLARASLPRFDRSSLDLLERMKVSVLLARRSAERAKTTAHEAD